MDKIKAAVLTASDRCASGATEDISGAEVLRILEENGYAVVEKRIVSDDMDALKAALTELSDKASLVITTGGTGFSLRDNTPEATMAVADKNAPGIAEYIRMRSAQITDRAMLSRGVSVIRKNTLIINLPGSVKAVRESMGFIMGALPHALAVLSGNVKDCGR